MIQKFKEPLTKLRDKLVRLKFFMDIGISFLTIINFALLVVTASDKLRNIIPVGTWTLVFILVPAAFILVISFGWFLDRIVNYQSSYYKIQTDRVPQTIEMLERIRNMEKILIALGGEYGKTKKKPK